MGAVLERFNNDEDGVESLVVVGDRGFHVVLRDTDADESVGVVLIFQDFESAVAKAKTLI